MIKLRVTGKTWAEVQRASKSIQDGVKLSGIYAISSVSQLFRIENGGDWQQTMHLKQKPPA